jgi:hypothetical protein
LQSLNRATCRFALLLCLDSLHFVALSLEPLVGVKEGSFQQDLALLGDYEALKGMIKISSQTTALCM